MKSLRIIKLAAVIMALVVVAVVSSRSLAYLFRCYIYFRANG